MTQPTYYEGPIMVRGKGTGFLAHPDLKEDLVIEKDQLGFALDGDIVKVLAKNKVPGKRQEGKVVEVVKSAYRELIGTLKEKTINGKVLAVFTPDNLRLHIRPIVPDATKADLGMKVVIEITKWSDPALDPIAKIIETLGRAGDHETEMQAIIRSGGFSKAFPESVQKAAQTLFETKEQIFADALKDPKRRDVRHIPTMTIDPVDAKDFDDALSCHTLDNGNIEVGIHIADVSHYVRDHDGIDEEARERATSVYLVDRVIPMLPEVLSNDLCSLRPNEDRLAFSAIFELDASANIKSEWYGQTIIHSDKRFSYEEAQEVINKQDGVFLAELSATIKVQSLLNHQRLSLNSMNVVHRFVPTKKSG
jgi:ribonuclease R